MVVLAVVAAVSIPALDIYLWGDDFANLNAAYELHESPLRAFEPSFVFFRPTMLASMALSYELFGTEALPYNLTTLAHHLAVVAMLFLLVTGLGRSRLEAGSVALLFGTTPLASEATCWTGARADVQLAIVVVAVLVVLARSEDVLAPRSQLALAFLYVAGAATKESWMVIPLTVTVFLLIVRGETIRRAVLGSLSGWVLLAAYILVFFILPELTGAASPLDYGGMSNSPGQMLAKLGQLVCHYLTIGHAHGAAAPRATCGLLALGGAIVAAWRTRNRLSLFGGVFLVLALAPTIRFGMSPSRFNYLPLIGFLLMIVPLISDLVVQRTSRAPRLGALAVVVIVVAHQAGQMQIEFDDYRGFADRHRFLAGAMERIVPVLARSSSVLLVDLGTVNGPIEFRDGARGLPKNIYPKPGGLWDLVGFHDLANFCGSPFERRMYKVSPSDVDIRKIEDATAIVFRDIGFGRCPGCTSEVARAFAATGALPRGASLYRIEAVGE